MDTRARVAALVASGVTLLALLLPQPASSALLAAIAIVLAARAVRPGWGLSRPFLLLAALLCVLAAGFAALGWTTAGQLIGAAIVSTFVLRGVCGYCIVCDLRSAWRRADAH